MNLTIRLLVEEAKSEDVPTTLAEAAFLKAVQTLEADCDAGSRFQKGRLLVIKLSAFENSGFSAFFKIKWLCSFHQRDLQGAPMCI